MSSRDTGSRGARFPVTVRAFVLGLLLVAGLAWLTPYNDYLIGATLVAGNYLPIGGFFVLTLLIVVVNGILRSVRPKAAVRPSELIVIWCMIATASSIPASGLMRFLIPHPVAPGYYASPENQWEERVLPHLPKQLYITDKKAVEQFFHRAPEGRVPWRQWRTPLLSYGVFVFALYVSFFCLSTLLRRQWVENERFTFPLVQLPVEMVEEPQPGRKLGRLWYDWMLWGPVLALTVIHTVNGLRQFWPGLPEFNLYNHVIQGIADKPWFMLNGVRYPAYPLVVGFGYLLKSEVLLSLWFFYVFFRMEQVAAIALGLQPAQTFVGYGWPAFGSQQAAGMALGLLLWSGWNSRHYLRNVLRQTFTGQRLVDDSQEALPLRFATLGWVVSFVAMYSWLCYFGRDPLAALFTMVFGTTAYVVLSWMVAQGGVLFLQSPWSGAEMGATLLGSKAFTPRGILVSNQIEAILMLDLREFSFAHLVNTQKFTDPVRVSRKGMLAAVAAAMVVTIVISGRESIRLPYHHGAATMYDTWAYLHSPQRPLVYLNTLLAQPTTANRGAWLNLLGGGVGFWFLMFLQTRLIGFPIHPAGFIFAPGYPMSCFWFSFFLAWLLKFVILRYGGLKLYQKLRPLFFGLILGDTLNGAVWIVMGLLTAKRYVVLPG